jgi:hypothetical protein
MKTRGDVTSKDWGVDHETMGKVVFTLWLFNSLPWKITMLLIGKPSISMVIFHGYVK